MTASLLSLCQTAGRRSPCPFQFDSADTASDPPHVQQFDQTIFDVDVDLPDIWGHRQSERPRCMGNQIDTPQAESLL